MDSTRTELSVSYSSPRTGPGTQSELDKCQRNEGVVRAEGSSLPPVDSGRHCELFPGCKAGLHLHPFSRGCPFRPALLIEKAVLPIELSWPVY